MPYITLRSVAPLTAGNGTAFSNIGHAWVEISGSRASPDGKPESYGYYPESLSPYAPGEVRHTDYDHYVGHGSSSQSYFITEDQATAFRNYAAKVDAGTYSILPGIFGPNNNCASFAFGGMYSVGITTMFPMRIILPWWLPHQFDLDLRISTTVTTTFHAASAFLGNAPPLRSDPLTLDLDNDGLETIGIDSSHPIFFDHNADGIKTATGWVMPDDGFLVLDRNGNGTIDDGTELFGDSTPLSAGGKAIDGFAALSQENTNGDDRVNAADARFSQLRIWRDLNQDGISQSNELFTLAQAGINALLVAKTENAVILANGNLLADLGGFIRSDGSGGTLGIAEQLADIDLASDPFYSQFSDRIPLAEVVRGLPDMQGSGAVRDLREAASLATPQGAALATRLAQYSAATTRAEQLALLDDLVLAWAATGTLSNSHGNQLYRSELTWTRELSAQGNWQWILTILDTPLGPDLNQQMLAALKVVEPFNGGQLPGNSLFPEQVALLQQSKAAINASVYDGLVLQTRLKHYLDAISLNIDSNGISLNYAGMMALLETKRAGDLPNAVFDLVDLSRYAGSQLIGWDWSREIEAWANDPGSGGSVISAMAAMGFATPSETWSGGSGADFAFGASAADSLAGNAGNDLLLGGGGNDTLLGNSGSDTLSGGAGDDVLMAGSNTFLNQIMADPNENAANTLNGSVGADRLYGGGGSDTYGFNRGDGADTITEVTYHNASGTDNAIDRILLGAGIAPADVTITRNNANLILKFANGGDQITILGWYDLSDHRVEQLAFADGTTWDRTALHTAGLVTQGTSGADFLLGLDKEADLLFGNAGNDKLVGRTGSDTLLGGAGDDLLRAAFDRQASGADISNQEGDANTLEGGTGNDTLYGGGGSDTYRFNRGDGSDTIWETSYISPNGTTRSDTGIDRIVLGAGIAPADVTVTRNNVDLIFKFSNGGDQITVPNWYDNAEWRIEQLVFDDGTVWDKATLQTAGLTTQGTSGADFLLGRNLEADLIYGNAGNDTLVGGTGSDTLLGGAGDDVLRAAFDRQASGADISSQENDANTLEGGIGNDALYGGGGSDTYRYSPGDGADTLYETSYISPYGTTTPDTATDRIVLGAGILPAGVTVTRNNTDLILQFSHAGDRITISGWYNEAGSRVEQVIFDDGTVWDRATLHSRGLLVTGTAGADTLHGLHYEADVLDGLAGNDQLFGYTGNDIYLLGLGSGQDTINENDATPGNRDAIRIKAGVLPGSVAISQGGAALSVSVKGTTDRIDVYNWAYGSAYRIEAIEFLDGANGTVGTVWTSAEIDQRLAVAAANSAPILAGSIANQAAAENLLFDFALPANTFTDANPSDHLSYSVTQDNGAPLPAWLSFDAITLRFSGTPTATSAGQLTLRVMATDDAGASASGTFILDITHQVLGAAGGQVLTGTAFRDVMNGLAGNDSLTGLAGDDTLDGGAGKDSMAGGSGDDIYSVDNAGDVVVEAANEGVDGVNAAVSYQLPENFENLALTGTKAINGTGNALNNTLTGNAAANVLDGGAGADRLIGGLGNDVYGVDDNADAVVENVGEGADTVQATRSYVLGANLENLTLLGNSPLTGTGNELNNRLTGNAAADQLYGLAGNDTLNGGGGADTLTGGTGDDVYVIEEVGDTVVENLNEGNDTVQSTVSYDLCANIENLSLTGTAPVNGGDNALNNRLTGNSANNVLTAGLGNDTLNGGGGSDTLIGGSGNDTYIVADPSDVVMEGVGEGTDTVQSSLTHMLGANLENLTLTGAAPLNGSGNDLNNVITGNAADNLLSGGLGNDTLRGGAGVDTLEGGMGDDSYTVESSAEIVVESADQGNDVVNSSVSYALSVHVERLTLTGTTDINGTGNAQDNHMVGNSGSNVLSGGDGNDTLNGGAGIDTLVGGLGSDTYTVDNTGDVVMESSDAGIDGVTTTVRYQLPDNVENLTLSGVTVIEGTGNALDNLLTGSSIANLLSGGAGNDKLDGKAGADTLVGGSGNDIYYLDNAGDLITEAAGEGEDTGYSMVNRILDPHLENLVLLGSAGLSATGNASSNLLRGNAGSNILDGGAGIDFLEGMAGNDTLTDTAGNNYLNGGVGNDKLTAGPGNDLLIGGPGNDTIRPGNGYDVIAFNRSDGYDTIFPGIGGGTTISLGGGITTADLSFRKAGNDLVLNTGLGEGMLIKNLYLGTANKSIVNLQVVGDAIAGFNFNTLVDAYNSARVLTPTLTTWALTNGLGQSSLPFPAGQAFGGDLAYQYGANGSLAGIGLASALQVMDDPQFGVQLLGLHPLSLLQEGVIPLI